MPQPPETDLEYSDELLNSFVDYQITREERQEILARLKKDEKLSARVCELQRIKEMTQLAYDDIPASRLPDTVIPTTNRMPAIAAAIAIFCIGVIVGLSGLHVGQSSETPIAQLANDSETKILLHLTTDETDAGLDTLNNLEQMLNYYADSQQAVRVEVIANGNGIKLLSPQKYAIAERIAYLTRNHDNLSFLACKNTIDLLRLTQGLDIQLVPQVKIIDSAVVEVIKRQQEGWTYIRG